MQSLDECIARAKAGDPVYITDFRELLAALPDDDAFDLTISVARLDGGVRNYPLRLPRDASLAGAVGEMVRDYFLAEVYNILSSLGGAAMTLHCPGHIDEGKAYRAHFNDAFGVTLPTSRRQGYGKCLNVLERMIAALPGGGKRRFACTVSDAPAPAEAETARPVPDGGVAEVFRRAAHGLDGKALLGIDIGGTDIKLVLAMDGRIACCKEFDWYPAGMGTVDEFVEPLFILLDLLAWKARAIRDRDDELSDIIAASLGREAGIEEMKVALFRARDARGACGFRYDAVGLSFPDVVVGNKIVGGETLKTRGMRERWGDQYDREFNKLTHLDDVIRRFVAKGGAVGIINDGPMAAFTAGVEAAVTAPASVVDGVFAHTLGTELGTGWVTETGAFPDIPLEVYNFIIDLGSWPERAHHPDDVRSVNNFNTRLPGTLQKYTSQSGVFRLAFKLLADARPDIIDAIMAEGFVVRRDDGLFIPTTPRDMRKPFLEYIMEMAEQSGDPLLGRIFEEIGVALAVTGREVDRILRPAARKRILFGRLVKRPGCFDLMRRGALSYDPEADLAVADDSIALTPLMRDLGASREYTIAQFAQAVGAVHFAKYVLELKDAKDEHGR